MHSIPSATLPLRIYQTFCSAQAWLEQFFVTALLFVSHKLYVSTRLWLLSILYVTLYRSVVLSGADAGQVPFTLYVSRASYSNFDTREVQVRDSETLAMHVWIPVTSKASASTRYS